MGMMKEYLMDTQERMIDIASEKGGISKDTIWDVIEAVSGSPTSEGPLEDTYEVCRIAEKGIKSIYAEYTERTGNIIKGNTILDVYEDYKYDTQEDMLCDIIYTIRELRREQ